MGGDHTYMYIYIYVHISIYQGRLEWLPQECLVFVRVAAYMSISQFYKQHGHYYGYL